MSDIHLELAELIADTRATIEHLQGRGVRALHPSAELPPPDPVDLDLGSAPEPEPTAPAASTPEAASQWASLASTSRQAAAVEAGTLDGVRAELGDCRRCGLCTDRNTIVFGVGDPGADLLIVGEAPGFHEDRLGEPFVGKAGEMLDRMLQGVFQLERGEVYIANVVKCRPPNNRNPLPDEVAACLPFLERQIAAIQPKVIVVLGTVALKNLFDTSQGIMRNRGVWREYKGIPAMPTFHPAYLLRNPEGKRDTFNDLKVAARRYMELGGKRQAEGKRW